MKIHRIFEGFSEHLKIVACESSIRCVKIRRIYDRFSNARTQCVRRPQKQVFGAVNGALVGSLSALTAVIIAFFGVFIMNTGGSAGIDIMAFTIFGALDVLIGAVLGSIGGLIGFYLENRIVTTNNAL